MRIKVFHAGLFVLSLFVLMTMLSSCGRNGDAAENSDPALNEAFVRTGEPGDPSEAEAGTVEKLSDEQVLSAIRKYCYSVNPDLEGIVNAGEYPVYWDISSSDSQNTVVLFRSYTGAQERYYVDRTTGDTYVTEYVPGIDPEEQQTKEGFNVKDYLDMD